MFSIQATVYFYNYATLFFRELKNYRAENNFEQPRTFKMSSFSALSMNYENLIFFKFLSIELFRRYKTETQILVFT